MAERGGTWRPQRNLVVLVDRAGPAVPRLLTARQVQLLLSVDRSTVYRMAEDGRLPALRVGRQWRFPEERIRGVLAAGSEPAGSAHDASTHDASTHDASAPDGSADGQRVPEDVRVDVAEAVVAVAAGLLGVMMLVTDLDGHPLTPVANPCPWFVQHAADPDVMRACSAKWHAMAQDPRLQSRFRVGDLGLECAHAFIRSGNRLVGLVLAGGVAPASSTTPGLYHLTQDDRERVLAALPGVAAVLSRGPSR